MGRKHHMECGKAAGVPFALPLAIISGFIAEFIPIVGTYLGGALPILVGLAEQGTTAALVVLIEILLYQQLENYVLSPRISAKTIELNPGIAFGAAMAGAAALVGSLFLTAPVGADPFHGPPPGPFHGPFGLGGSASLTVSR